MFTTMNNRGIPGGKAADAVAARQLPPGVEMMLSIPVICALDLNRDGELSEVEIANKSLMVIDKNQDGRISIEEMKPDFAKPENNPSGIS